MYNVMIVDDELWFRSYLKELIDQSGSEFLVCAQAANGAEALKILAAQPVDVVIADVLMPVMDGVALMQHLSDLPHRLPVLALRTATTIRTSGRCFSLARRTICSNMRSALRLCGSIFSAPPTGSGSRPR